VVTTSSPYLCYHYSVTELTFLLSKTLDTQTGIDFSFFVTTTTLLKKESTKLNDMTKGYNGIKASVCTVKIESRFLSSREQVGTNSSFFSRLSCCQINLRIKIRPHVMKKRNIKRTTPSSTST